MKQETAIEHLRVYMISLQKYRSNIELDLDMPEDFKADAWPWIFGDKCPLPQLSKVLDLVDNGQVLNPLQYHNFMIILYRFYPEILTVMGFYTQLEMPEELPSVLELANGWED